MIQFYKKHIYIGAIFFAFSILSAQEEVKEQVKVSKSLEKKNPSFYEVQLKNKHIILDVQNYINTTILPAESSCEIKDFFNKRILTDESLSSKNKVIYKGLGRIFLNGKKLESLKDGFFLDWLHEDLLKNQTPYYAYDPNSVTERNVDEFVIRLNKGRTYWKKIYKISNFSESDIENTIAFINLPGNKTCLTLMSNKLPYMTHHALLVSNLFENCEQVLNEKILKQGLEFLFFFKDSRVRIGCSLKLQDAKGNWQPVTIDHFHWQLFSNVLPIENNTLFPKKIFFRTKEVKIFKTTHYPLDGYLFQSKSVEPLNKALIDFIKVLNQEKLVYNLLGTFDACTGSVNVFVIIRKLKTDFGIIEACGCIRVENEEEFNHLQVKDYIGANKVDTDIINHVEKLYLSSALEATVSNLGTDKFIKTLQGNSDAQLFLIERKNKSKQVIKLAYKKDLGFEKTALEKEFLQLQYLHNLYPNHFSKIFFEEKGDYVSLRMNFIEGLTLEECFCDPKTLFNDKIKSLKEALSLLLSIYSQKKFNDTENFLETAHFQRVKDRLALAQKKNAKFQKLAGQKHLFINGEKYESYVSILNFFKNDAVILKLLTPPFLGLCAHGDFIPSNILIEKDGNIQFIDVRGVIPTDGACKWDYIYDLGKLKFYLSSWKLIIENKFDLQKVDENSYNFHFQTIDSLWRDFYFCSQHLTDFLTSSPEFVSLAQEDPYWKIRALFSEAMDCFAETSSRIEKNQLQQAIAVYLMGTIQLNRLKDLLEKEKDAIYKNGGRDLSQISNMEGLTFFSKTLTLFNKKEIIPLQEKYVHQLKDSAFLADSFCVKNEANKLLYKAKKNFLPIRAEGDYEKQWRFDLTIYSAEPFQTHELNRSTGHLNGEKEIEIFQVWEGKVRIYYQIEKDNQMVAFYQDLGPGEYSIIPPGAWHSTHVLEGPAVVGNICNREGFFGQENKPYRGEGAFTFCQEKGFGVFPILNPKFSQENTLKLIEKKPDLLPENISSKYKNLSEFFTGASLDELEEFAQTIFKKKSL